MKKLSLLLLFLCTIQPAARELIYLGNSAVQGAEIAQRFEDQLFMASATVSGLRTVTKAESRDIARRIGFDQHEDIDLRKISASSQLFDDTTLIYWTKITESSIEISKKRFFSTTIKARIRAEITIYNLVYSELQHHTEVTADTIINGPRRFFSRPDMSMISASQRVEILQRLASSAGLQLHRSLLASIRGQHKQLFKPNTLSSDSLEQESDELEQIFDLPSVEGAEISQ